MTDVAMLIGDVFAQLATLPDESVDCCVTSPPYWGLRDYGVEGQIGLEPTLGEHLAVMVRVFDEVRRVLKPAGTCWINYGDCYATKPNGRSAADTKAAGNDDRTFRDKPFSTVGPIYEPDNSPRQKSRQGRSENLGNGGVNGAGIPMGRVVAGGMLKPKDLCMVPNRLAIALQDAGWWVRSEIVWGKPNGMPDSSGRYRPSTSHEKIFMLSKSATCFYDAAAVRMPAASPGAAFKMPDGWDTGAGGHGSHHRQGREKGAPAKQRGHAREHQGFADKWDGMTRDEQTANGRLLRNYEPDLTAIVPFQIWHIPIAGFSEAHFATFPPLLPAVCIIAGCPDGGVVLDPFGGAGTTGMVAQRLGRSAILIELNPEYAALAERRIGASDVGLPLGVAA